ncbi:MAG: magnesium transporter [Hyphomicrobiaceae bacterium]|nr:magnesium transporter [Hyphomicrobiaceae bacterium]
MASEDTTGMLADDEAERMLRLEDGGLNPDVIEDVERWVEEGDAEALRAFSEDLHESDVADILVALSKDEQSAFVQLLGDAFDFATLTELDENLRVRLLDAMEPEVVAAGVAELDSDDAVYILEDLDEEAQADILRQMPSVDRLALQRALDYPEETAGRRMQSDFIAVPPFWNVGRTIDYMRDASDLPDEFHEIFVVDPAYHLQGSISLNRLLRTKRPVKVSEIMEDEPYKIDANVDQEEAAYVFQRYNLVSAAVVDDEGRLVGVLTVDDIVDVIQEEAEEDLRALAGVGDEEVSDSVTTITRSRLPWLVINLATAILASLVIGYFDATIEQMVALAILMPIVASMGGNAATQTMTVAVRAIATRELSVRNMSRVIGRETVIGIINGLVFAVLMGTIAALWFGNGQLGGVIGAAMIVNMLAAGLAGILIPVALDKAGADPAIASGPFVTTVTDVVGFFAFLGFAAWWFGLS